MLLHGRLLLRRQFVENGLSRSENGTNNHGNNLGIHGFPP
jgi:hypothetical protein